MLEVFSKLHVVVIIVHNFPHIAEPQAIVFGGSGEVKSRMMSRGMPG